MAAEDLAISLRLSVKDINDAVFAQLRSQGIPPQLVRNQWNLTRSVEQEKGFPGETQFGDVSVHVQDKMRQIVYGQSLVCVRVVGIAPPFMSSFFAEACVKVHGSVDWETAWGFSFFGRLPSGKDSALVLLDTLVRHRPTGQFFDLSHNRLYHKEKWFLPLGASFVHKWKSAFKKYVQQIYRPRQEDRFLKQKRSEQIFSYLPGLVRPSADS